MNIIYVIEDYSENGGVERIVSDKANTLFAQYNHNVTVISVYLDNRKEQFKLNEGVNLIHLDVPFAKRTNNSIIRLLSRLYTIIIAIKRLNKEIKQSRDYIRTLYSFPQLLEPFSYLSAIQKQERYMNHILQETIILSINSFSSLS